MALGVGVEEEGLGAFLRYADPARSATTDGKGTLTYAELEARAAALAAQLRGLGIGRGSAAAIWAPNGTFYLLAIFALARLGAIAVHVNTRFGDAEAGDVLRRSGSRVLLTRAGFAAADVFAVLARIEGVRLEAIVCEDAHLAPVHVAGAPVLSPETEGFAADDGRAEDACLTYTTSGTTAKPKLVLHTQRSIGEHAREVAARIGFDTPGSAYLAAAPLCGTFGNCGAMAAIAGGAHVVCQDAFEPAAADRLIRRHAITHALGDDRMLGRLAAAALEGEGAHTTLRFFGAATFHPDAAQSCAQGVEAGLKPHAIYGSSEVQALYALGDAAGGGLGSVTPVSAAARIRIEGEDGSGELRLGGPSLFAGYLGDPAASAAALTDDGLFRSGDLARREGEGFVFEGRMGDVLRLGGFLVNPAEIEAFLQNEPGVAAAAVVGVEEGDRRSAFAFVVPEIGRTVEEAALLESCRRHLARYKAPVRAVAVDAFPYSQGPNGPKIARAALRRRALN